MKVKRGPHCLLFSKEIEQHRKCVTAWFDLKGARSVIMNEETSISSVHLDLLPRQFDTQKRF
jgi:hypothetical protein